MSIPCTAAILRFPRRYPLSLLVIIVPFVLLVYNTFGSQESFRFLRIQQPPTSLGSSSSSFISVPTTTLATTTATTPTTSPVPTTSPTPPPVSATSPTTSPVPTTSPTTSPVSSTSSHTEPSATHTSRILLVSAFYPLSKSKHSVKDYTRWLTLFLSHVTTDVYFFTQPEWEPIIRAARGALPIHVNTTFASPFDIPPLRGRRDDYRRMHAKDRERQRHSPELYATWAAKPFFLKQGLLGAREESGLGPGAEYKYAFWADAGTFREKHGWREWPDVRRVDEVWAEGVRESGTDAQDLVFFPIEGMPHSSMSMWTEGLGPIDNSISEGSFFGGMPGAIAWWHDLYYSYHDHWLEKNIFVGKDQTLINALFFLYPSRIIGVWHSDPMAGRVPPDTATPSSFDVQQQPPKAEVKWPLGQCVDRWYYYVFFLGSESERASMAEVWFTRWQWMWPWDWIKQWGVPKEHCRLTRVLSMEHALKRVFGDSWSSPSSTVKIGKQIYGHSPAA